MTSVLLTIDTELWLAGHQRGMSLAENFDCAIMGRVGGGEWGVGYQARKLAEHGLKAVFLVEALSASVFGLDVLKRTLDPILSWGHAVELHLHTEWLDWLTKDPVGGRRGRSMCDFSASDQKLLLELGIENLTKAGAPAPKGFRAGNYGANNDTLRMLARVGLEYDTSYDLPYLGDACRIVVDKPLFDSAAIEGLLELPVSCFEDYPGHFRHAQLCAVSSSEIRLILRGSAQLGRATAVIVSHSFELLNLARTKPNRSLLRRFDELCGHLAAARHIYPTKAFAELRDVLPSKGGANQTPIRSSLARTVARIMQQGVANMLYS